MKNPKQKIIDSGLLPDINKIDDELSRHLNRKVSPVIIPAEYKSIVNLINQSVSLSKNEKRVIIYDVCKNRFSPEQIQALTNCLLDEISSLKKLAEKNEQDQETITFTEEQKKAIVACFSQVDWTIQKFQIDNRILKDNNNNTDFYATSTIDEAIQKLNNLLNLM